MKIRETVAKLREETYFTFTPILGPGTGGRLMQMSPIAALAELRERKDTPKETSTNGFESIDLWLDDQTQIIINNFSSDGYLNSLSAAEVLSLIQEAYKNSMSSDDLFAYVHRFG